MTHPKKNKKILIYIFLFILLGTTNNEKINNFNFPKIKEIKVSGLGDEENIKLSKRFNFLKIESLFFLNKSKIEDVLNSNNLIERYFIFKIYPSSLEIKINKVKYLAYVNKNGINFFLGSNGKFINANNETKKIPFLFGNFKNNEFYQLKKIIDKSNLDYQKIKKLFFFPSGRWDIEMHSGLLIKLPKDKLTESLDISLRILSDNEFKNLKIIDLRQKNQVVING